MLFQVFQYVVGGGLALAAFKLSWSVDRTQKEMLKTQVQLASTQAKQTVLLQELLFRVEKLESK